MASTSHFRSSSSDDPAPSRLWHLPCGAALGLVAALAGAATATDNPASLTPFSTAAPGEPPAAWRFATLPRKTPTRFSVVELDGARVLKVEADASYGNLVQSVHLQPSAKTVLAWKWRVDKLVDGADLTARDAEDAAAKLCVFFAFDAARLPFGERTKLSMARSVSGEEVPTEALCYVWDNKLAADTAVISPFTRRIRSIVVQTGSARLAQWQVERRTLEADYKRLFGDESDHLPEITGIAVSADADNSRGRGLSYFGDVELLP